MAHRKNSKQIKIIVICLLILGSLINLYMVASRYQPAEVPIEERKEMDRKSIRQTEKIQEKKGSVSGEIVIENDVGDAFRRAQGIGNGQKKEVYEVKAVEVAQKEVQTEDEQTFEYNEEGLDQKDKQNGIKEINQQQKINKTAILPIDPDKIPLQRVKMGQPKPVERSMKLWIVSGSQRSHTCAIMNAVNLLTVVSIQSSKHLIETVKIGNIIFIADRLDNFADELLAVSFESKLIRSYNVDIDSDYRFIRGAISSCKCQRILYLNHNFKLQSRSFPQLRDLIENSLGFTTHFTTRALDNEIETLLPDLSSVDLSALPSSQFNRYMYIFDSRLLGLLAPLNFAYYAKFTVEELLVIPVLALSQKLGRVKGLELVLHGFEEVHVKWKHFQVRAPEGEDGSLCFVSYPSNPETESVEQIESYLRSVQKLNLASIRTSIVAFIPYGSGPVKNFDRLLKLLFELKEMQGIARVKLQIGSNRTVSSLSVFKAVYSYCPNKSLIISSRHNVQFNSEFAQKLSKEINNKSHYYFTGHMNEIDFRNYNRPDSELYERYFQPLQIFKSDLFKSVLFWYLKSGEIEFFQTEASFVLPMLELADLKVHIIKEVLFSVRPRKDNQRQLKQIAMVKKYPQIEPLKEERLSPIIYNSLFNQALRRNSLPRIPKRIHLTSSNHLSQIQKIHPQFQLSIWSPENVTVRQFPLTYSLITRSLLCQKCQLKSLVNVLIAYEALYNYGGLYLSEKAVPMRSLEPFLKYEMVMTDFEWLEPWKAKQMIIGFPQHSYDLKILLSEILTQSNSIHQAIELNWRASPSRSFNDEELFIKACFGFNLFQSSEAFAAFSSSA